MKTCAKQGDKYKHNNCIQINLQINVVHSASNTEIENIFSVSS